MTLRSESELKKKDPSCSELCGQNHMSSREGSIWNESTVEVTLSKMKIKLFLLLQLKLFIQLVGSSPGEYLTGTMPVATQRVQNHHRPLVKFSPKHILFPFKKDILFI